MKRVILILIILGLIVGCGLGKGEGGIVILGIDSPPPRNLDNIYLKITEIRALSSEGEWITLDNSAYIWDIMRFFNGGTGLLCVKTLEAGHYTDIWLEFADTNGIVIDGVPYPLIIQNEEETGVKLAQEFDVTKDETVEIVVDFEASKSIEWTGEQYLLHPEFRVFEKAFSGAVLGSVEDTLGAGIPNALCEGVTSTFDTLSTLTDSTGGYVLILLRDTYKIIASAEGYTTSDTVYSDVVVVADSILEGYDFILQ